jgi:hypothetical protein
MTYIDINDAVPFDLRSPRKDEAGSSTVRLTLNYETGRWELQFDGPGGESTTAVSEGRTRVRLHRDGTFDVLEQKVPVRRVPWSLRD